MTPELSVYLDVLRFSAAMIVFLGHVSGQRLSGGFLWPIANYMDDAVIAFFVLSGFVISHATSRSETILATYAINRAARIYSVAIPALAVTFALDAIGRYVDPALYSSSWGYIGSGRFFQAATNALFISQSWKLEVYPGSDLPYWSLALEVWYYVIFGLVLYLTGPARAWSIIAMLCAGPRVMLLFPIWLLGAAIYRWRPHLSVATGWVVFLSSLAAVVVIAKHFPTDPRRYVVGLLFAANIIGARAISPSISGLCVLIRAPVRWLAGATFTLYLFHLPLAQFINAVDWLPAGSTANRGLVIGGSFVAVLALSLVTERQKRAWGAAIRSGIVMVRGRGGRLIPTSTREG